MGREHMWGAGSWRDFTEWFPACCPPQGAFVDLRLHLGHTKRTTRGLPANLCWGLVHITSWNGIRVGRRILLHTRCSSHPLHCLLVRGERLVETRYPTGVRHRVIGAGRLIGVGHLVGIECRNSMGPRHSNSFNYSFRETALVWTVEEVLRGGCRPRMGRWFLEE